MAGQGDQRDERTDSGTQGSGQGTDMTGTAAWGSVDHAPA